MRERWSRRRFLTMTGTAALGLAVFGPDLYLAKRKHEISQERLKYPPLSRPSVPDRSILVGTSPNHNQLSYALDYEMTLGARPNILNFFVDFESARIHNDLENIKKAHDLEYLPMVSFGFHFGSPNFDYQVENALEKISTLSKPVLLRPWYESNGVWAKDWYGNPSNEVFKENWTKLYGSIHKPGINAYLVYSANTSFLESVDPVTENYTRATDVVALDLYNKKSINRLDPRYYAYDFNPPSIEIGKDIADFQTIAHDKPLLISEINASVENYRGEWIANSIDYAIHHGAVAVMTFDWNKKGHAWDEFDWRITEDYDASNAIRREFSNPFFVRENLTAQQSLDLILSQPMSKVLAG